MSGSSPNEPEGAKFQPVANLTQNDTADVPADFLIDADGILRHVYYGNNGADSLSVDEVLAAHRAVARTV